MVSKSSLFYLKDHSRTRDALSKDREGDTDISNCIQEVKMLLHRPHHSCLNRLTIETSVSPSGSSRTANNVVYRYIYEFDVFFESRKAVKAQLFVDFIAELTIGMTKVAHTWVVFTSGSSVKRSRLNLRGYS